jgi:Uma2 family endonuclease
MAATVLLTLEEFHARYANEHGYEYWFGKAVRKGLPTTPHGILQGILMLLLSRILYAAGSEIELRIDPDWEPRPDVLASRYRLPEPYPTKPDHLIVFEVLSPDDTPALVVSKCLNYERIGIQWIFVVNPIARTAEQWSPVAQRLFLINTFVTDQFLFDTETLWKEFANQPQPAPEN